MYVEHNKMLNGSICLGIYLKLRMHTHTKRERYDMCQSIFYRRVKLAFLYTCLEVSLAVGWSKPQYLFLSLTGKLGQGRGISADLEGNIGMECSTSVIHVE